MHGTRGVHEDLSSTRALSSLPISHLPHVRHGGRDQPPARLLHAAHQLRVRQHHQPRGRVPRAAALPRPHVRPGQRRAAAKPSQGLLHATGRAAGARHPHGRGAAPWGGTARRARLRCGGGGQGERPAPGELLLLLLGEDLLLGDGGVGSQWQAEQQPCRQCSTCVQRGTQCERCVTAGVPFPPHATHAVCA